jgi:hypothetical protein
MKVIDLLNKIANSEKVPKKIKYDDEYFVFNEEWHTYLCCDHDLTPLFDRCNMLKANFLNDEVEILENTTEEIEELNTKHLNYNEDLFEVILYHESKINELVKAYNKLNNTTYKAENCMTD